MKKETQKIVKEITSRFTSLYSKESPATPQKLSVVYLQYKAAGTPLDTILPYVNHRRRDDREFEAMKATEEHKRLMRRGRNIAKDYLEGLVVNGRIKGYQKRR